MISLFTANPRISEQFGFYFTTSRVRPVEDDDSIRTRAVRVIKKFRVVQVRRARVAVGEACVRARCSSCNRDVEVMTKAEAAALLRVPAIEVQRLIEEGRVHTIRTVTGDGFVCRESLFLG